MNCLGYDRLLFLENYASPDARLALNLTCTVYLRVSYDLYIVHVMVLSQADSVLSENGTEVVYYIV